MPHNYLHGRVFDPEELKCMGLAYEAVCERLGLLDKIDPVTEMMVAEKVILFARRGVNDPAVLCEEVIQSLRQ
jgi:hypothetical protein